MALDHFVSQVYLKNFYALDLKNRFYAIRKSNLQEFTPRALDVCRLEEGNTNPYVVHIRVIEQFLRAIEPRLNQSIDKFQTDKIDHEAIYVVAGFAAYVMTCSPTGARLGTPFLKKMVEIHGKMVDERGEIPEPPELLGGKSFSDLIDSGKLKINIDEKYPQSMGIRNILRYVQDFGNFHWEVIENDLSYSPFLTSDYPVAIEETVDNRIVDRLIPLSPSLAVRICPRLDIKRGKDHEFDFPHFRYRRSKCSHDEVRRINANIVKCAEDLVFSCVKAHWLPKFVKKHRSYRVEGLVDELPTDEGSYVIVRQRVVSRTSHPE